MREHKSSLSKNIAVVAFVVFVVLLFILLFMLLNHSVETKVSSDYPENKQEYLVCTRGANDEAVFHTNDASRVKHEVKIIFDNNVIKTLFYEYEGSFSSNERADEAVLAMHIKYDLDMQENEVSKQPFSKFWNSGSKGRVDLHADVAAINATSAKYFFINDDMLEKIYKTGRDEMEKYYEGQKFACEKQ